MPRKMKLLPPGKGKAVRKVQDIEARRTIVKELMLSGKESRVTNADILKFMADSGYAVSIDTLLDDKRAVEAEVHEYFKKDRERMAAKAVAQFLRLYAVLEEEAEDARRAGEYRASISARSAQRQVLTDLAKVAGFLVERQEVQGQVTNVNLNAEMTPEEKLKAVKAALRKARIDEDGKPLK